MKSEDLRDLAIKALDDMKGIDIVTMDVRPLTSITDYMIICTGRSTRHVKALADAVAVKGKEMGAPLVRTEGERQSEWILVDLGDVVVHIMLAATRAFYSLEDLWEPVKELREQKS
ncbi:Ribosomal silencing factor RsfS [Aquicella siphonis]|uniref:Ribosomal silencing factor RsfS n=1 Tax=Aquicella siphonis TaxID=254247 RepID=A0A5E4PIH4_9COXI|nr:ribosome silencing factor [Aquicella siphonis]VVC76237.1 Ribosomal silencing factor RsfS [Aquicella siphonis]